MVQDSITDHIFDRLQFFFKSSYRVMIDINGKVFSLSIGWRHSFGKIRSRIQINPNEKLIGQQCNGHAALSNQRCHDVTVSTVFQRNTTDLASARTTKRTSTYVKPQNWRTNLQKWSACHRVCVLGKYALSIVIFIIRSSQWRGHERGQATRHSMVTSISRWPKLASCATHRRRKGRGLAGAEEKRASCLARRFSFSAIAF